jgi:hypothetical protein
MRVHLLPAVSDKPPRVHYDRGRAAPQVRPRRTVTKNVNNILTVLNVLMRTAVEWDLVGSIPCAIKMLGTPKTQAVFYGFDQFE